MKKLKINWKNRDDEYTKSFEELEEIAKKETAWLFIWVFFSVMFGVTTVVATLANHLFGIAYLSFSIFLLYFMHRYKPSGITPLIRTALA